MAKLRILFAVIIVFVITGIVLLSVFYKPKYPRPSREYYINDFAEALLPGSCNSILANGEKLYEDTKDESLGGAQIVVATILLKSEDDVEDFDTTKLFRKWRIGENDMGLLILLLFVEEDDGIKYLVSSQIEMGYRMEEYVTAARAGYVLDNCLYNPEWEGSIDMGLGEMYFELQKTIYIEAYGYESYTYDMEAYRNYLIESQETDTQVPMSLIGYIFSPYSSVASKIFVILLFLLVSGGGLGVVKNRGGGGSSGGYRVRR